VPYQKVNEVDLLQIGHHLVRPVTPLFAPLLCGSSISAVLFRPLICGKLIKWGTFLPRLVCLSFGRVAFCPLAFYGLAFCRLAFWGVRDDIGIQVDCWV
jgi:hypothetical protein